MVKPGRMILVIVVVALTVGALGPAHAQEEGSQTCVDGVLWELTLAGGTLTWVVAGSCQSEGSEEPGEKGCQPIGAIWTTETCTENGRAEACIYRCTEDGWVQIGCGDIVMGCVNDRVCYSETGQWYDLNCWDKPGNSTPCEDLSWSLAGIQCFADYDLSVSVSVPCQRVVRTPYPRSMVAVATHLQFNAASPAWNEAWSRTIGYNECLSRDIDHDGRAVKDFKISLAWGRMNTPPYWEIEGAGSARGWETNALWQKASYFGDTCGPGLDGQRDLPAYRGRVYTYWTAYWRIQYDYQKDTRVCKHDWKCGVIYDCPDPVCDEDDDGKEDDKTKWVTEICDDDEDENGIPDDHCWAEYDSGWVAIDLREFGYPTPYFVSGLSGPDLAQEPGASCNGFCIPVIEVQGPIANPRH